MNKLIIFISLHYSIVLFAQNNDTNYYKDIHKSVIATVSIANNSNFSTVIFNNKPYRGSHKLNNIKKFSLGVGSIKPNIKHKQKFTLTKNKFFVRLRANYSKQNIDINRRMDKIYHRNRETGIYPKNAGVSIIVGELSNAVDEGLILKGHDYKKKTLLSFENKNPLLGHILGSIFTPSGFIIGLTVPVRFHKTDNYRIKRE